MGRKVFFLRGHPVQRCPHSRLLYMYQALMASWTKQLGAKQYFWLPLKPLAVYFYFVLHLNEEVLTNVPKARENIASAIDIKGVFDNISDKGILDGLAETNCSQSIYYYVELPYYKNHCHQSRRKLIQNLSATEQRHTTRYCGLAYTFKYSYDWSSPKTNIFQTSNTLSMWMIWTTKRKRRVPPISS